MGVKLIVLVSLLFAFILPAYSYDHIATKSIDFDLHIVNERTVFDIGGLNSSTTLPVIYFIVGIAFPKKPSRYNVHIKGLLRSFIPLLIIKRNLITIKFQSTFFSPQNTQSI